MSQIDDFLSGKTSGNQAGPMSIDDFLGVKKKKREEVPGMTPWSAARDVIAGGLQIGPTAVKGVADLARLVTGDTVGKDTSDAMEAGMEAIRNTIGSDRAAAQRERFNADMADDSVGIGDAILNNKAALADQILPTIGSMFLPVAAAGAAGKVATLGTAAQALDKAALVERVIAAQKLAGIGTVAAQNAADTFSDLIDKGVPIERAYGAAGITVPFSVVAGKLTGGGAETALTQLLTKSAAIRTGAKQIAQATGKEGAQEMGEEIGQVAGEAYGTGELPSPIGAAKRVAVAGTLGAVMGGGVDAAGQISTMRSPQEAAQPPDPSTPNSAVSASELLGQPNASPQSNTPPTPSQTPGVASSVGEAPEVRLAQLDLIRQQRDLTPQEVAEANVLLAEVNDAPPTTPPTRGTPTGDTPAPIAADPAAQAEPDALTNEVPREIAPESAAATQGAAEQPAPPVANAAADASAAPARKPASFWSFLREQGIDPRGVRVGTEQHAKLKAAYDAMRSGATVQPPAQAQAAASVANSEPVAPFQAAAEPVSPVAPAAPSAPESALGAVPEVASVDMQNRDRSRLASVQQMQAIAAAPDYLRLGPSRTPDSGAPMVFAVGDQMGIAPIAMGRADVAVMSDGQRVPFRYAVVPADQVQPSNFADGSTNPAYTQDTPGMLKALNNGRTAGLRQAYRQGTAENYRAELVGDAQAHGISPDVIAATPNPMLVRVYSDTSNTSGMAAKSQGQGLGMSPVELARQDASLVDASLLSSYSGGDIQSAGNRVFASQFVGRLQQAGLDVSTLMQADGSLSQDGRKRLQAALMQAAYSDTELVQEMFESTDTDIKAIGEALKAVAPEWALMRSQAASGQIDPDMDITGNLLEAVRMVRKYRQEGAALFDQVNQTDLLTGEAPNDITIGALRIFYTGKYLTRAAGRDSVENALRRFINAAQATSSAGADMFGEVVTAQQILSAITQGKSDEQANAQATREQPDSRRDPGGAAGADGAGGDGLFQGGAGQEAAAIRDPQPEQRTDGNAQEGGQEADAGNGPAAAADREGRAPDAAGADGQGQAQAGVEPEPAAQAKAGTSGKIEDVGEKIGGARKDTAVSTGPARRKTADDARPTWAKRFQISQIVTPGGMIGEVKDAGRWVVRDTRSLDRFKQPQQVGRNTYATKEEAEAALPLLAVGMKHRPVPTREGRYEIWREVSDRKRVKVVDKVFDTRDDAMRYMVEHAQEIIETNTTFGEADIPLPPDRARTGPQRREGDVSGNDFKDTFGLRAVEFGNWNNQDERQALMNDAWDGLMDLADVLGVPPKALGLNGDLALAFGARGHGLQSARAHYEMDRAVINLTKEKGAGSLAHEWFHALDHYFGRQDGKASAKWVVHKDGTRTLEATDGDMASAGLRGERSGMRPELRDAYKALIETMFKKAEKYVEDTAKADKFTATTKEELARQLDMLRKDLSEQKDPKYWKRNNKPASAELLAEFDTIAKAMLDGDVAALVSDWRSVQGQKAIAHRWTNDALERLGAIYKEVRGRSGFNANSDGVLDRLRGYMNRYSQRLKMLADAQHGTEKQRMTPTDFAMAAKELDQGRGSDYWTTPHEMAARAFQGYVEDKISERGGVSRFLNYGPENVGILTPWGFKRPFPAGQERVTINKAFDAFVGELKTREDEAGNVALFSRSTFSPEFNALKALSETDALFRLPKSEATEVAGIAAEHDPDIQVRKITSIPGETRYNFTLPSGKTARMVVRPANTYGPSNYGFNYADGELSDVLTERPGQGAENVDPNADDVWIDVSLLESGDEGRMIYNIASTFAHNTGRIFIGDPAGLSNEAMRRRPEQMLSSALKWGTTKHLAPHPRQVSGDARLGIPPLDWRYGDDLHNIRDLIRVNLANLKNAGADGVEYDPATGNFLDAEGKPLDRGDLALLAKAGYGRSAGAGAATLARGSVLRALSREEGGPTGGRDGRPDGLLARLLRESAVHPQATKSLFYSLTDGRGRPGALEESKVRTIADTIAERWSQSPTVIVVPNMQDPRVPEEARKEDERQRAKGATGVPRGFYHRGTVYLVADGLKSVRDVAEALFHEALGHYGLRAVFGADLNGILDQIAMARPELMKPKAAEYGKDLKNVAHRREVAEEVLAELAQTQPNIGFVRRAVAAIRTWLRKNVPSLKDIKLTDDEIINSFILPARNWVKRGEMAGRADGKIAFQRVWHGSPHRGIDKFSTDKIGTGEGAQAYGWGLYFASKREIAEHYRNTLSGPQYDYTLGGNPIKPPANGGWKTAGAELTPEQFAIVKMERESGAKQAADKIRPYASGDEFLANVLSVLDRIANQPGFMSRVPSKNAGQLYEVEIPKDSEMLLWDKPLSEQPEKVREALREMADDLSDLPVEYKKKALGRDEKTGEQLYRALSALGDDKFASNYLASWGIKGIKYLDGGSRADGDGSYNYVIFDGGDTDIVGTSFSRSSQPQPQVPPSQQNPWQRLKARVNELTSAENIDSLIYQYQDKHIDLKRLRERIKALGGTITDLNDAYLGEELYHKRVAKRTEDFLAGELKPLLADIRYRGQTIEEVERFLHARHAPEANRVLAERNPSQAMIDAGKQKADADVRALELQLQSAKSKGTATKSIEEALAAAKEERARWNGAQAFQGTEDERLSLSGMTDDEAKAFMDGLKPGQKLHLEALAARVDAMIGKTRDALVKYGLETQATIDQWKGAYQFYVPLHRDDAHPDAIAHPIGQGFSTKGSASKRRTGSNEAVTHILAHIAMQREAALTRGEKNIVAKKLYLMAAQNPDPEVWQVDKPPTLKTINQATGFVQRTVDPTYKNKPNVLMVRIAGTDAAIVFNEHNPQAVRLAAALKNLDGGDLGVVWETSAKITRWFSAVNTQYNPVFGIINFMRDVQAAALNLSTTPLKGREGEVMRNVLPAMRAVYRAERGKAAAGQANAEWMKLWDDLQLTGGATGYREAHIKAQDRMDALAKEMKALDRGRAAKAAHAVVEWLSDYNEAMENSTRVAAYKAALDMGMSKEQAASLAKNLTVNFNRKGNMGRHAGALYAFFNAAVQGNARLYETLRGPMGKRIIAGGLLLGVLNSILGMAIMGGGDDDDDEWAKIPEFVKERSVIIPLSRKDYVAIPLPLGFHVLPNIGRLAAEVTFGPSDKTLGKAAMGALSAVTGAFNPMGGSDLGSMIAPTVFDPMLALYRNEDWTGRKIYREDNNPLDPTPGHARAKDSASSPAKAVSWLLNKATGGSEYRPGAISWTPDQIDYVVGQITGGVGRELMKLNQTAAAPFTGDELPIYKVPLVGRIVGNTRGPSGNSEAFYANIKELNEIENEIKGLSRNNGDVEAFRRSEPLSDMVGDGNAAESQIRRLRHIRRGIQERKEPGYENEVREINDQIGEVMAQLNRDVAKARRKEVAAEAR